MKAFVYRLDDNGKPVLPGRIVGPYANRRNLERFGLRGLPAGDYWIEAPHSWDRRFSLDLARDFQTWIYRKF